MSTKAKNGGKTAQAAAQKNDTQTAAQKKKAREEKIAARNAQMSSTLTKYRAGYATSVTANGRKSKVCGDDVSWAFEAVLPTRAMAIAELLLSLETGFLAAKYDKLNEGQRKMNSVNRVRGAVKRGELTIAAIKKGIKAIA